MPATSGTVSATMALTFAASWAPPSWPFRRGRRSAVSGGFIATTGPAGAAGLAGGEREALHVGAAPLPGERHPLALRQLVAGVYFVGEAGEALVCLDGAGAGC